MTFEEAVETAGKVVEGGGVAIILLGAIATTAFAAVAVIRRRPSDVYRTYRRGLGRAILLGLEFLVAGDIIRTVAVDPSFQGLGVLAGIVAIRTFLSFALEMEVEGRLPWRPEAASRDAGR